MGKYGMKSWGKRIAVGSAAEASHDNSLIPYVPH
ncbi:hypothetical protein Fuma_02442 [Fuerstiella marisgermanici]|uniref:Uncharacterized protein n=1 Tax=Fuerstiella marisgermanici TaxID=1891926 RepID=A0A1P8WFL9_9PLAN|nr:hypothetical protein Fuma_02442 [Fuerstiella marisgermanici]